MKLLIISLTYHNCPVETREKAALSEKERLLFFNKIRNEPSIKEAAVLQTCNRTEIYTYSKKNFDVEKYILEAFRDIKKDDTSDWDKCLKNYYDKECIRHLFKVVGGLDSQMIGENQILCQAKAAYAESVEHQMSGFVFHKLFHTAFRVGKAVRTQTDINCGAVSVALAAVEAAGKKIDLSGKTVMVIGSGENAKLLMVYLNKSWQNKIIIANRSVGKAQQLCDKYPNSEAIKLSEVKNRLNDVDIIISTTGADKYILSYEDLKNSLSQREQKLLIIDIAVPRDIDPKIQKLKCVNLLNIDDLNEKIKRNLHKRKKEIPKAKQIIEEHSKIFIQWYQSLNILPLISELLQNTAELAKQEAKRYSKDFGRENCEKLEMFAQSLAKKILHQPITFLKGKNEEDYSEEQLKAADLINKMFNLQLQNAKK